MSSRVLKKGERPIPAVEWRPVSGAPPSPGVRAATPHVDVAYGAPAPPPGATPEIARLQHEAFEKGLREGEVAGARKILRRELSLDPNLVLGACPRNADLPCATKT